MDTSSLENKLAKIENYIPKHESLNSKVSKATVGWHLDHNLKVMNSVVAVMKKSDVTTYRNNFSFLGRILFTLGSFPKGKAKAPKHVLPPEIITEKDIYSQLQLAKKNISEIQHLSKNAYFKHPMFGNINKVRVVRFLDTHTNHHLKIIKDILR